MYYLQSRYYNPELGRFISADDYAYISNVNSISLNAYCYCANNPIMHFDPTGKAWVSDVGIQVAEIISVIMATWDAFVQGGKDFAAMIAQQLTTNKGLLYQPGKNHMEQHLNFEKWFNNMLNDFLKFTETAFYKFVKFFNDNFFVEFAKEAIKNKVTYYYNTFNEQISAFFGIGNSDSILAAIADLLDGHFEIFEKNGLSSGLVLKLDKLGIYFQITYESLGLFTYGFAIDITIDRPNFDNWLKPPDFPLGTTDNMITFLPAAEATISPYIIYTLLILLLGAGAGLVFA